MPPYARTLENIRISLISLEATVTDELRTSLLLTVYIYSSIFSRFHVVVSESDAEKSSETDDKRDFSIKWHIKAKHFKVTGKPIKHTMTLHKNVVFSCDMKDEKNCDRNY